MRIMLPLLGVLLGWPQVAGAAAPAGFMVELNLDGRKIEGTPLSWNARQVHLLGRDGRLWEFAPEEATDFEKIGERFRCYSPSKIRAMLLRELGDQYEVTGTSHYMVAHPRGQRDKWAERFENLYRSFVHFFSVRGFKIEEPPFPLIGIVCRNREQFFRYSAKQGGPISPGVLGYYALGSNRITLYDQEAGRHDANDWHETATTLIHEATHQTAFNTGVHSRTSPPPLWVAEGLATNFEAPGVYDSRNHPGRGDRINRGRFEQFRRLARPRHKPELVQSLVVSDQLFRSNAAAAYAEAWALTFYLLETQPRKYCRYLARTASHPSFEEVSPKERLADFQAFFGDDWRMLEARFLRFLDSVP